MKNLPSLEELLKSGVHFGHQISKWHPKMEPYIFTSRNGVHIIDLQKTLDCLKSALKFLKEQAAAGKVILVVGTKKAVKDMIKKLADGAQLPSVTERWLGGTLTNFKAISQLVERDKELAKQEQESSYQDKYTKWERQQFSEERQRLERMVGGIKSLTKIPDVLFVVDMRTEDTAIKEARKLGIPIVAIVDTNSNPALVDIPIPANDDSIKSVGLMTKLAVAAIADGQAEAAKVKQAESKDKPEKLGQESDASSENQES